MSKTYIGEKRSTHVHPIGESSIDSLTSLGERWDPNVHPRPPASLRPELTRDAYLDACDALAKAVALEAEHAHEGEGAMARWAVVAVPRFRELSAVLDQAEREDWARSAIWFAEWKAARQRDGRWPFDVDGAPAALAPEAE